jgi:hypothetical protein
MEDTMKRLTTIAAAVLMVFALSGTSHAWFLDFENGAGSDATPIFSTIPGLQFTTTDGFDWLYADITTDNYNVQNDDGDMYGSANWFCEGDVFAWLGPNQGDGRIDFLSQDGSYFTTGYSSESTFYLEAYDAFDNLIDSDSGPGNTVNNGGSGLDYLTVNSAAFDIAYVIVHDTGNFWLVDNISGDASDVEDPSIPEPATLFLLGAGLLGGGAIRRKLGK